MKVNHLMVMVCLVALFPSSPTVWAQPAQSATPDFSALKQELEGFQEIIQRTLVQNLQGPVPILSTPKGTYLADYGAVFNVEGNLYETRTISPFNPAPLSQKELDDAYNVMLKRVEVLRERILHMIGEYGASLQHVKPEDKVAVVVHLFNGYADPKRPFPSQLIFRVSKAAVNDYRDKKISFEDLAKRIEITRF